MRFTDLAIVVAPVALVGVFVFGPAVANKIAVRGEIAAIESLRRDVASTACVASEDVVGQVTQWNQTIARKRQFTRVFVIGMYYPNEWDAIAPIEAKVCENAQ
jgi:hypothetical protein